MKLLNPGKKLTRQAIERVAREFQLTFPDSLISLYLQANGGEPETYVFQKGSIDTVVTEFLALTSTEFDTSPEVYRDLVLAKQIVPKHLYPFAIDGGGDYFFIDTSDAKEGVYLYLHDTSRKNPLVNLKMTFADFWESLIKSDD